MNIDLIYGIPGQTVAEWREDLDQAVSHGARHVSCYALTLDDSKRGDWSAVPFLSEDLLLEMWHSADEVLGSARMRRYEISNFAYPGHECRHNMDVWHGGTYLGCGPSACSFDGRTRRANVSDFVLWLKGAASGCDELSPRRRASEIFAFGLRTADGWDGPTFHDRTGFDLFRLYGDKLAHLQGEGLLEIVDDRVVPTYHGLLFADTLVAELLL